MVIKKERLSYVDKACGIAILLVVYGHIIFPETMDINWYDFSNKFVYKFHMPLFMYLSGFLAFLSVSSKSLKTKQEYLNYQKKKLYKFLPIYLLAVFAAVLLDIFYKELATEQVYKNFFTAIFIPASGTAAFIWYLYVLFGFYLITPFLINFKLGPQFLILLGAFLLTNFKDAVSPLFSTDLFCKYFFFFFSGGLMYLYREQFITYLNRNGRWIMLISMILIVIEIFSDLILPYQVMSIGVILSVMYISILRWPEPISKIFILIGKSSFAIYILNSSVMNLFYIFYKLIIKMPIDGIFIISTFIIAVFVSVLIRITFNKIIPSKVYSL